MPYEIKCRKCRKLIIQDTANETKLFNAHGAALNERPKTSSNCQSLSEETLIFLNEDFLPDWITRKLEEVEWTRGRIHCSNCDSRLGAFDFVSGTKCACNETSLPFVHVIRSKVDLVKLQPDPDTKKQ